MTKIEPITTKFNKVLRKKFINSVSTLHSRLILQICNYQRCCSGSNDFIECVENLRADSIRGLLATIQSRISSKQCVTNASNTTTFMAITTCFGLHRPSSDHYYKSFRNKVKIQCSYNSHCGIPHMLQKSLWSKIV